MSRHRWALILMSAFLTTACSDIEEFASFDGTLQPGIPDCMADEFPMSPEFLSLRQRSGTAGVFLQSPPDIKSRNDLVYFEIFAPDAVTAGTVLQVGLLDDGTAEARGKIAFFSSCTYSFEALDILGTIEFDSFELDHQGVIAGSLRDAQAVEPRSGDVFIEDLQGSWQFRLRLGPPYEDFYALPERPEPDDF